MTNMTIEHAKIALQQIKMRILPVFNSNFRRIYTKFKYKIRNMLNFIPVWHILCTIFNKQFKTP